MRCVHRWLRSCFRTLKRRLHPLCPPPPKRANQRLHQAGARVLALAGTQRVIPRSDHLAGREFDVELDPGDVEAGVRCGRSIDHP